MEKRKNNILTILVLYNVFLEDSVTFKSLLEQSNILDSRFKILIYDNSLSIRSDLSFLKKYEVFLEINYVSDNSNPGISQAYNYAFKLAKEQQLEWLLLLDQDTKIPFNYLQTFIDTVDYANESIVSYVPRISDKLNQNPISPFKINSCGIMRNLSKNIKGQIGFKVVAINSGAFVSINFLSDIDGFSKDYPLDMLDFWLFTTIYDKNKCIHVLDIDVLHDLSILNFEKNISLKRYESILLSENLFFSKKKKWKFTHKIRLIKRLLQLSKLEDKSFFKKTLMNLFK